jgi:histidine triad (HIT) family protein
MAELETLFLKIISREIPADIVYEDDHCLAFKDINPQAPIHVLLIPKIVIPKLSMASTDQKELLGHLMLKAGDVAHKLGIGNDFRLVVNNGEGACQTVFHLHLHILGGRGFTWPPG